MSSSRPSSGKRLVQVRDVTLCVETFRVDSDPALLLIAGTSGPMDAWDSVFCQLIADGGRYVIRYDNRDTGASTSYPAGHPGYSFDDLTGDAIGLLDSLDVGSAHVSGESLGGAVARAIALHQLQRVETLALISSTPLTAHADERSQEGETGRQAAVEPSDMARRPTDVKPILVALVALPLIAACSSAQTPHPAPQGGGTSLSQDEIAKAEAVARKVIADQGAAIWNATVIERPGRVKDSNTGHPCASGRELQVKLIGGFPHTVTTGHPVAPGSPTPDFTVRAMIITADAESGLPCLIGVQTAENGEPKPLAGGTPLSVG